MNNLTPLMETLGVTFSDPNLLQLAITHRSYINENPGESADNERLEFLGDAVLDFVVGAYLYNNFPEMHEGEMTSLRAALVRSESLADFAREVDLGAHLRLGVGEEDSGGRNKAPTLCAAFEAVVGAIYLDQGFEATVPLIEGLAAPALERIRAQSLHKDAKSEFQVWAQAEYGITPRYEVVAEAGPDHAKTFTVQVVVDERVWGSGSGRSKRQAAQEAARSGLIEADVSGWERK